MDMGRGKQLKRHAFFNKIVPRNKMYLTIGLSEFFIACLFILFAVLPPFPTTPVVLDSAMAVVLSALALWAILLAPRVPNGWGADITLAFNAAIMGPLMFYVKNIQGQMGLVMFVILLGVLAAYYRPLIRALPIFAFAMTSSLAGLFYTGIVEGYINIVVFGFLIPVWIVVFVFFQHRKVEAQATHDPLTGLYNRRGMETQSVMLGNLARRTHTNTIVVLIDLDKFKEYNDTYGHLSGDQLLINVAEAWSKELRNSDVLSRFGGDEFALTLPDTTLPEAEALIERLHAAYNTPWSAGVTVWRPDQDYYTALGNADKELYSDKSSRR